MADSEDVQWQVITYDEPRRAPLRTAMQYYTSAASSEFFEMQDVAPTPIRVVVWTEWRAPQRSARYCYFEALSATQDEPPTDGTFDYVISAYADSWRLAPSMARLLFSRAEDGTSIAPEIPVDPSTIGKYRPTTYRIARLLLYTDTANDADAPAVETQNPSMVVGMRYRPTIYKPNPLPASLQYGDEGILEEEACAPRDRGPGVPTTAGLERYVDGETCDPRETSNSDACEGR